MSSLGGADPRDEDSRGKSVVVDTVWSFDPIKRCWYSEHSLNTKRKNFGLVVSDKNLYAIGGQDSQGRFVGIQYASKDLLQFFYI